MTKINKNNKRLPKVNHRGFAALYVAIILLALMTGIALLLTFLTATQQRILGNYVKSYQSYSLAEGGIEDALLRLSKSMSWSSPYNLTLGSGSTTVGISDIVGGTRIITSTGNINNRTRKIQVVFSIESDQISFYYGAQIGDGGMVMSNNSQVQGNVFSNGTITGGNGAKITNSVIIAGNGNKLQNVDVGGDADVHTCADSDITGTLRYVSGGSKGNCTYGAAVDRGPNEIEDIPLPIPQSQIDDWKAGATAGGIIGSKTINGTESLGPVKIVGDLTFNNNATLNVTGTIYVTGNITTSNSNTIKLDASYGSLSGVIMADGSIIPGNNANFTGSGQAGSYILVLSTKTGNGAITIGNNALGAIFYTSAGGITLNNNVSAREVTGYQLTLNNNVTIQYESGLENANFSNGPGGSWEVVSWKEIE